MTTVGRVLLIVSFGLMAFALPVALLPEKIRENLESPPSRPVAYGAVIVGLVLGVIGVLLRGHPTWTN